MFCMIITCVHSCLEEYEMEQVAISLDAYICVKTGIFANAVENSIRFFLNGISCHIMPFSLLCCVSLCQIHQASCIFNSIISFDKKDIFPCWKTSFYLPKV